MLKTKKLNQIKYYQNMSKICYDKHTWFVQFADQKQAAKKVTKNWNWPFLIFHY